MISVEEAQQEILKNVSLRSTIEVPLLEAVSRTLAQDVCALFDSPPFDNSAMDGYAIHAEDTAVATQESPVSLRVAQTIAAGEEPQQAIQPGEAARIFTGAMIPPGTTAVIKQEDVLKKEGQIAIRQTVSLRDNIRCRGEEIKKGGILFHSGEALNPAGIGLLASFGLKKVTIFSPPRLGIIVTGSEIISEGNALRPGQLFDSNSFSLRAAFTELNLQPSYLKTAVDQREPLRNAIDSGLEETDFLIVTGGVSVGDYDFVKEVAAAAGIEQVFWKVAQKPGKPIFFGKRQDGKLLFGLPGNPASALVCFYEYVRPAILKAMGANSPLLPKITATLAHHFRKKEGRVHFLRSALQLETDPPTVHVLEKQGSHIMKSFAAANCLVVIPAEKTELQEGERVEAHLLP